MQRLALIAALPVGATIAGTPAEAEHRVSPVTSATRRHKSWRNAGDLSLGYPEACGDSTATGKATPTA
jgi:hypothetical protein